MDRLENVDEFPSRKSLKNKIVDAISDDMFDTKMTVLEEQKEYVWIRVYTNNEYDVDRGDDIRMTYVDSGEYIDMPFATYEKKGMYKDNDNEVVNYTDEFDKKVMCLMVDIKVINTSEDIPFVRTLFKSSRHFEHQLLRRTDLIFTHQKTGEIIEYYSVEF